MSELITLMVGGGGGCAPYKPVQVEVELPEHASPEDRARAVFRTYADQAGWFYNGEKAPRHIDNHQRGERFQARMSDPNLHSYFINPYVLVEDVTK